MSVRTSPKSASFVLLSAFVVTAVNYAAPPGGSLGTGDTLVGSATNAQLNPAIARDADGDYVVVWQSDVSGAGDGSDVDIYFQRYTHNGAATGSAVRVNTTLAGVQQTPAVAMDASGNFVIVWDSDQAETPVDGTTGIWGQRFDNTGAAQGVEFQVNTYTTNLQAQPAVAMDADGDFVVAWQSLSQDGSGQGIFAQRFANTGAAAGSEFQVNTFITSSQTLPAVAMGAAGAFVITWQSNNQAGGGLLNDIYAQRYLANGTASGGELLVNTTTAGEQRAPRVGLAHNGSYAVAWESADADGTGIFARIIDASGSPVTAETQINATTTGEQTAPSVAVDASGDFVVAWQGPETLGMGVWFQRVNAAGTLQGIETPANATGTSSQQDPAVAADADGDFVMAWESDQVALNGFDIYARRFSGPENVDLSLSKTDSPDPVVTGNAVTYTLAVTNHHAVETTTGVPAIDTALGSANGIVVTDTLPTGRMASSASGTGWTCSGVGTGTVTCSYGPVLAAGATTSNLAVVITTAATPGEITNNATVVANQSDTDTADNTAQQKTATCALTATPGSVQFASATYSFGENAGTATISATRTGGLCGSVSVSYGTANGSAAAGSDYTAASGTLTWDENDNANKTFVVPLTSDAVDEPNETVALVLSNADRATLGTQNTATLTITDDDAVTVSFSPTTQTVDESAGMATVTATRTGATTFDISVPFTVGGTATGADHGATNDTIVILAGSSSASYTFAVGDDALDESNETVVFTAGTPTGGNVTKVPDPMTHTVTVTDNDNQPTVNFNPFAETLTEGNSGMQGVIVTAELDAVSGRTVTVPFTVSGTATDVGEHTAVNGTITISAGSLTGTATFNVNGDTRHEDDETIVLTMGTPVNAVAGTDTVHTTTIENDDNAPGVTLELSGSPFAESPSGVATVTARLDAVSGKSTVVHLDPAFGGTATLTTDYTRSGTDITIPAGSTTGTITLAGVTDTLDETNETVIVDIDTVDNGVEAPLMQQVTATITDDDNAPNVTLSVTGSPLAEEAGAATVSATLAAASAKDTTITLTFSGTAISATDYTASGTTLVIPAGATTPTTPVTITGVGDALDEANESVIVDMSCDANCTEATVQQVTATITDDDAVTVKFAADQTVAEDAGMVTVTVTRTGASTFPIQVPFTLSGNAANPADHGAANGTINVPASANATETGTYTFTLSNDPRDEVDETLTFTMGTPTGGSVTAAAPTTHTVTITDNDAVTVSFSTATQNPGEAAGNVTVTATRSGVTDFAIDVPFTVTGSSANPADHNAVSGSISIPAASASGTYVFALANDVIDELDETVVFTIGAPTGGTVTAAAPSVQTVTIADNDNPPTVQFTAANQSVAEDVSGGTATMTLQLSGPSGLDVTVQYGVTAGNATNGTDYTLSPATPGPVLIPAGQTSATITVTVNNDGTDEPNETSTLTLTSPSNASLGTTTAHVLTIVDNDDLPQVSFTASGQTKSEADGSAQIVVQLSRPSSEDINVPFTVTGSSGASDRTVDASPVTVIAGNTTAVINVSINNDALDEVSETAVLTLGTPTNATPAGTTVHTLNIADNDTSTVSVAATASATEASSVSFALSLSTPSDRDLTVTYSTADGTATSADYTGASGATTTIPAGATTGSILVATTADTIDETNETFTVTLTGVDNGAQIGAATGTGTITDDDTSSYSINDVTVTEGNAGTTTATFTVTRTANGSATAVDFTTTGGTATEGTDFADASGTLNFPADASSSTRTISVTVNGDLVDEGDEAYTVTLSNATGGVAIGDATGAGAITDDDTASYSIDDVTVTEGNSGTTTATFTVTRTASALATAVDFTTASDTATEGTDFADATGTLNFTANAASSTRTISVLVSGDLVDEVNEGYTVTLSNATGGTVIGDAVGAGTITDDDAAPSVNLSVSSSTFNEESPGNTVTLTATLVGSTATSDVTVDLSYAGSAVRGADYSGVTTIVVPALSSSASITLTAASDALDEGAGEDLTATIASVSANATVGATNSASATLIDDDAAPGVTLALSGSPLAENGGVATVTATLSAVSAQGVTVNLGFTGTAANPADYARSGASIFIAAGSTTGSVTLTGVDDALDEADESVVVDISSVSNGTETGTQQVTASIADDDAAPGVALSLAGSPLAENGGVATVTATLSAVSGQAVTVNLAYTGTAAGADYAASTASIVIAAGSTTGTATITGANDAIDELGETVVVDIASVSNGTETGTQQVVATITDDDAAPTVTLSSSSPTMAETGGTASVTATLSGASSQAVTVNLVFAGTATNVTDYTSSAAAITIAAGATSGSITLSSVGDGADEPNETVVVDISAVTNGTESGVQSQTVSITDDDAAAGGGGGGGGSFGWLSLWLLVPALVRRRRYSVH